MPVLTTMLRTGVLPCQATVRWLLRMTSIQRPEVGPVLLEPPPPPPPLPLGMRSRWPTHTKLRLPRPLACMMALIVVP